MTAAPAISVLSSEFLTDPYPFYATLRDEHPVYVDDSIGAHFISRYVDVRRVLGDPETFSTLPLAVRAEPVMRGRVLAQMSGREHAVKQRMVVRELSGAVLDSVYRPAVLDLVRTLRDGIDTSEPFDLVEDFGARFAVAVTLTILGLPQEIHEQVREWHTGVADFVTGLDISPEKRAYDITCSEQLEQYLVPIIELRRRQPGTDLISALCAMHDESFTMSTSDIVALSINILLAATEPADKTLAMLFHHLLERPAQLRAVVDQPDRIVDALAETLRYTAPVQLIPRQTTCDVTVADTVLPTGTNLFCLIGSANRDPRRFTDPDTFDIDRADVAGKRSFTGASHHLAFGTGLHFCVGAAFAKMQLDTAARELLPLIARSRHAPGYTYQEHGLYTRGPKSLRLVLA